MDFQTLLDSLVEELQGESYALGGLLHGSFASGSQHEKSDVDLLCVTDADWYSKEIREVEGFEVEIQKVPEKKVRSDLTYRLLWLS